jgi:hypothetical protein
MKGAPAEDVDVQVKYALARACAGVDDGPVARGIESALVGEAGGNQCQMAQHRFVFRLGFEKRCQMFAGND